MFLELAYHSAVAHRVGIIGGSGYTGAELLRLLARHPSIDVAWATGDSTAGAPIAQVHPGLALAYAQRRFEVFDTSLLDDVELVFACLPHGAFAGIAEPILASGIKVVDLSADFRLRDAALYDTWYHAPHPNPELIEQFAFGIPELFRDAILAKTAVASAGCYVTTAALGVTPFVRAGLVDPAGVIVDAASGTTGAGKGLKDNLHFSTATENFTAYGVTNHRHTPEIEQAIGLNSEQTGFDNGVPSVTFTPHLAPMARGILATSYLRPNGSITATDQAIEVLADFYSDEPFVGVSEALPSTLQTRGSNTCAISARYDARTDLVVVVSALDNLTKGASGQAVQCANLLLGESETLGLPLEASYP